MQWERKLFKMNRLVITAIEHNKKEYTAYLVMSAQRKLLDVQLFEPEDQTLLDHIYVGFVERIIPNIQAAFVRIANGQKCYLPLSDLQAPIYAKKQSDTKILCEGDEILVQVTRDAVKTKDPVVSTKLTLHGHYCFLTTANTTLGTSRKITGTRAEELLTLAKECCEGHETEGYGLVFRTNAASVDVKALCEDIAEVQESYRKLMQTGVHETAGSLLYRNIPGYLARLKAQDLSQIDRIDTDRETLYEEIAGYLPQLSENGLLKLYKDDAVSLSTLYHIRGNMEELLSQKVWLASGANIIIESLETMTVIDVNSGKNQSRKEDAIFAINLEAAREIARQLRLRNISGMIIVDFINLKSQEQKDQLIACIKQELKKDTVSANFIDITKLGLVELTRKKVYKSLREILQ